MVRAWTMSTLGIRLSPSPRSVSHGRRPRNTTRRARPHAATVRITLSRETGPRHAQKRHRNQSGNRFSCWPGRLGRQAHAHAAHAGAPGGRESLLTASEHLLLGPLVALPDRCLIILHGAPAGHAVVQVARDRYLQTGGLDVAAVAGRRAMGGNRDRVVDRLHQRGDLRIALMGAEGPLDPVD